MAEATVQPHALSDHVDDDVDLTDQFPRRCGSQLHGKWQEPDLAAALETINNKLDALLASTCGQSHNSTYRQQRYSLSSAGKSSSILPSSPSRLEQVLTAPSTRRSSAQSCEGHPAQCVQIRSKSDTSLVRPRRDSRASRPAQPPRDTLFTPVAPGMEKVLSEEFSQSTQCPSSQCPSSSYNTSSVYGDMSRDEVQVAASRILRGPRCLGCLDHVWRLLEDPEYSPVSWWFARLSPLFILSTVMVTLLQTLESPPLGGAPAAALETAIDCVFLAEFLLRFVACPNRWIFFFSYFNMIDLASAAPLLLRAGTGFVVQPTPIESVPQGILLCFVPIIRLLKTLRRFEKFHLLLQAFRLAFEALPVLLYLLFVITLIFAVLIYLAEPRTNIASLSNAIWFTIVTMTTVGYGDCTPQSTWGTVITGVLVVVTVLYMAVPLGIIGDAFTQTWNDRDRLLLTQRTRERLRQWGYGASDIPILFHGSGSYPGNGEHDGTLNMDEFRCLIKRMQIGFSDERIYELFRTFDRGNKGCIDDKEFVRTLFPNDYEAIYEEHADPS